MEIQAKGKTLINRKKLLAMIPLSDRTISIWSSAENSHAALH
jgi:hypothetical protein